jgi:hypothetical protein
VFSVFEHHVLTAIHDRLQAELNGRMEALLASSDWESFLNQRGYMRGLQDAVKVMAEEYKKHHDGATG